MTGQPRHIISTLELADRGLLNALFASAQEMDRGDRERTLPRPLHGRILATLFYEPSTRTRFSFESAMQKLGGGVISAENMAESSSAAKGESIGDTIRVVSGYADAIVIRHYEEGTAALAASFSPVPVINAGDGIGEHPTQALIDLYTIETELGRERPLRVALVGDLLHGRTIHSLLPLLCQDREVAVSLVAPPSLELPEKYVEFLRSRNVKVDRSETLNETALTSDVIYVTRVQRERFRTAAEYDAVKDAYSIDTAAAARLKRDAIIMHALPRVNEISPEVDQDDRAAYFRQARNGLYVRMALLEYLLG